MSAGMSFASFLAAILVLLPLPWHWRARNVPTLSIIAWLFVVNITHGINTIVWHHNVDIKLVAWCDITTKLDVGANIALPAACFCLCMNLESLASLRKAKITHSDKRRRMLVDLVLCVAVPAVYMALHYVVQGHLFDIVEDFGCRAEDYVSIPEFFLMWLLPILFCLGTFVFAGLAFVHFLARRATFAKHLAHAASALTPARYFRLMAMSLVEMFWALLVIACTLYFNYRSGLRPWISWANVHSDFSHINQFPLLLIPRDSLRWTYFLWWTTPISAYIFFVFFAFGQDAVKEYGACVRWVRRVVLRQKSGSACPTQLGSYPQTSPYPHPSKLQRNGTDASVSKMDDESSNLAKSKIGHSSSSDGLSSMTSTLSCCEYVEDSEKIVHAVTDDGPFPPYLPPSPIPTVGVPPAALVGGDHVLPLSRHAHTDHVV
ncbi:hypothetical protein AcW1_002112 [Taiwanofungus camphoratus]|nr:hypothetical protein AcW1_002112 [Antrodia cinnamomea]